MSTTHTVPSSTYKYFDLPEFLNEIPQEYVRMQALQSYAWRIDSLIVAAVRELFKISRDAIRDGNETADDLNIAMATQEFAEAAFEAIGSDSIGPVRTIHEMLILRATAHELAEEATHNVLDYRGNLRQYNPPSIEELLTREVSLKPKADSLAKIRWRANHMAAKNASGEDLKVLATKLYERGVNAVKARNMAMNERMKDQHGGLLMMFKIACSHDTRISRDDVHFWTLHIEHQRALITNAKMSLDRAMDYAQDDSSLNDEFPSICLAAEKAQIELNKVLKSPKFTLGVGEKPSTPAPTPGQVHTDVDLSIGPPEQSDIMLTPAIEPAVHAPAQSNAAFASTK